MAAFDNLMRPVNAIQNSFVTKADYTEELERLHSIKDDLPVARYLGTLAWKVNLLTKRIDDLISLMHSEAKEVAALEAERRRVTRREYDRQYAY
jgi:signal transduction histidine kinase